MNTRTYKKLHCNKCGYDMSHELYDRLVGNEEPRLFMLPLGSRESVLYYRYLPINILHHPDSDHHSRPNNYEWLYMPYRKDNEGPIIVPDLLRPPYLLTPVRSSDPLLDNTQHWHTYQKDADIRILKLRPEDIHIEDIAQGLSGINRYAGHTEAPYSVLKHSLHVVTLVKELRRISPAQSYYSFADQKCLLATLLHDAPEAYINDMIASNKSVLPGYKHLESYVDTMVHQRFRLPYGRDQWGLLQHAFHEIDQADKASVAYEKYSLLRKHRRPENGKPLVPNLKTISAEKAKNAFLARFREYSE